MLLSLRRRRRLLLLCSCVSTHTHIGSRRSTHLVAHSLRLVLAHVYLLMQIVEAAAPSRMESSMGSFYAPDAGVLLLRFDNCHAWWRAKVAALKLVLRAS